MSSKERFTASHQLTPKEWLEPELYGAIGLVVSKHAYLETMLQHIIYDLVGVDDVVGRIAIREPRTSERLTLIEELSAYKEITLEQNIVSLLRKDLPKVAALRDNLAHGIFFQHPDTGETLIRELGGRWQPPGVNKGSVKKRIHPPASKANADKIAEIAAIISAMIAACRKMRDEIRSQIEP